MPRGAGGLLLPKDPEFREKYGPRGVLHSRADGRVENTGPLTSKADGDHRRGDLRPRHPVHRRGRGPGHAVLRLVQHHRMHVWTHLKKETVGRTGVGLYPDGMVEHDDMVGALLGRLEELGI